MGMSWAEHSIEIDAPIETCFDAIVDYESFPGWQNAVDSVVVRDRHPDGLGHEVQLFVDAKIRKIDYVLRYSYERPTRIEWDFVEGNGMREVDGIYTFEELGPERTRATYKLGADPEIPMPGMVLRRTHGQLVKRSVEDLKREAERRVAGGGTVGVVSGAPEAEDAGRDGGEDLTGAAGPGEAAGGAEPGGAEGDGWRPKAARERPAASARPERPASRRGGIGSIAALPGEAAARATGAARGALRAGRGLAAGVVKGGLEKGADLADRVDRRLSGRDDR